MNLTRDWLLAGYILLLTISPLAPTGPLFPRTPGSPWLNIKKVWSKTDKKYLKAKNKTALNNVSKKSSRKTYAKSGWSWWTRFSRRTLNSIEQKEDKFGNELQYHWVIFFSLAANLYEVNEWTYFLNIPKSFSRGCVLIFPVIKLSFIKFNI